MCHNCHKTCLKCSGSKPSNCITCPDGRYFEDKLGKCTICTSDCKTCSEKTTCLSCFFGKKLNKGSCTSTCDTGFYNNEIQNICSPCLAPCILCTGPSDNECNSCIAGYFYDLKSITTKCKLCNLACLTCNGPLSTNCITCTGNYYLTGNSCLKCADGKFVTIPASTTTPCTNCNALCKTCTSYRITDCLTCNSDRFLSSDGSCTACHESCLTCTGPNNNNCINCKDKANYIFMN